MRFSAQRDFQISLETPIVVETYNDYANVQGRIEMELLSRGLNVVPRDIARTTLEETTTADGLTTTTATSVQTYYPSALVLEVRYGTRTDMIMTGFSTFSARFVDLSNERVIGIANFNQGANWVSVNHTVRRLGEEIEELIVPARHMQY